MGQSQSIKKVNFEDIQQTITTNNKYLLINTLKIEEQKCLIKGTISPDKEISVINSNLNNTNLRIIIYGKNAADETIYKKYNQLIKLGFYNIYLYPGGVFEWLLLQDIYGDENFQTTTSERDILKYKGQSRFHLLLTN